MNEVDPDETPDARNRRQFFENAQRPEVQRYLKEAPAQVRYEGRSQEELVHEASRAPVLKAGIPVTWSDANTGQQLRGKRAEVRHIHAPDAEEIGAFAEAPRNVCGECRHFALDQGRTEMVRQRFPERLVRENEWKLRHLGASLDHLAICAQRPSMIVSTISASCESFRPKSRSLRVLR